MHISLHPSYPHHSTATLIEALWEQLAEANLLIAPGTMFSGASFGKDELVAERLMETKEGDGFFRLSFSTASEEDMKTAAKTIGKVVKEFFAEE